ncbi:unnamed protein product [Moritella viscosa]|nr:unnamed protein product [Moritella viscosa]
MKAFHQDPTNTTTHEQNVNNYLLAKSNNNNPGFSFKKKL